MTTSILLHGMKVLLCCVAITACTTLKTLRPLSPEEQSHALKACTEPFPGSAFRAIHKLSFTFSGNRYSSFIGVTVADQEQDRIRSALVSAEGVTVFDAVYQKGEITIHRWMLPGDAAVFGSGLFEDVRFIFLRPAGENPAIGLRQDGQVVCRFFSKDMTIEVVPSRGDTVYELKRTDLNGETIKTLHMQGPFMHGFAKTMTLQSLRKPDYSLVLELLEEEPLLVSDDVFSR